MLEGFAEQWVVVYRAQMRQNSHYCGITLTFQTNKIESLPALILINLLILIGCALALGYLAMEPRQRQCERGYRAHVKAGRFVSAKPLPPPEKLVQFVTASTSQSLISWLKTLAPENMPFILVTIAVFQPLMS